MAALTGWYSLRAWGRLLVAATSVLLVVAGVDVMVLDARIQHVALSAPSGPGGQTWVIVGSDSRADLPAGAATTRFGSVSGARADIVLLIHRSAGGRVTTLSVPRDILLHNRSGQLNRLALAYQVSPQNLVESLCATLNVPTDHLVVIDFAVFTAVVDALGGITLTVPTPLRDQYSGLDLTSAGTQRLTGDQALALVRSRHPEREVGGRWSAVPDGAAQRTSWGGEVFGVIVKAVAQSSNPLRLQRLAWIVSGSTLTDAGTGLADLATIAAGSGPAMDLPVAAVSGGPAVAPSEGTYAALAAAGFDGTCR